MRDEVPLRLASSPKHLDTTWPPLSELAHVIRRAVAVDADKDRFPRDWLFHRRWGRDASARTTAWVPAAQS